jgi:hypothetical protein
VPNVRAPLADTPMGLTSMSNEWRNSLRENPGNLSLDQFGGLDVRTFRQKAGAIGTDKWFRFDLLLGALLGTGSGAGER